jgi:hypothetical protein
MTIKESVMALSADNHSFLKTRAVVAGILLDNALAAPAEKSRLTQRDLAGAAGADWYAVHMALKSLRDTGAIKIDRNRILCNREGLKQIAEESAAVPEA